MPDVPSNPSNWRSSISKVVRSRIRCPARTIANNLQTDRQTSPDSLQILPPIITRTSLDAPLPCWNHELIQRCNKEGNSIYPANIDCIYPNNSTTSHQAAKTQDILGQEHPPQQNASCWLICSYHHKHSGSPITDSRNLINNHHEEPPPRLALFPQGQLPQLRYQTDEVCTGDDDSPNTTSLTCFYPYAHPNTR